MFFQDRKITFVELCELTFCFYIVFQVNVALLFHGQIHGEIKADNQATCIKLSVIRLGICNVILFICAFYKHGPHGSHAWYGCVIFYSLG